MLPGYEKLEHCDFPYFQDRIKLQNSDFLYFQDRTACKNQILIYFHDQEQFILNCDPYNISFRTDLFKIMVQIRKIYRFFI